LKAVKPFWKKTK